MRYVLFLCLLAASACASPAVDQTPDVGGLVLYQTITPSPTGSQPSGLVVSLETPFPTPTPFTYTIAAGDTMSQIAEKFHVSLDSLVAANPKIDPNAMPVGQTIQVPTNALALSAESTPTPAPLAVSQITCHPTADGGMWCFILARNDTANLLENITAQVTLTGANGKSIATQTALLPLDILAPGTSLPLATFFAPNVPSDAKPQVQILTAFPLLPGDPRYLAATIQNTVVQVDWSGLSAQITGTVNLPPSNTISASHIWVAAAAYDSGGNVVGLRRWESNADIRPGGSLPFTFLISSVGGAIERVDFAVEARP